MVRGLRTNVSYSIDSFIVQQFEDLFDRGKNARMHSYNNRSEFVENCLKQFIEKLEPQLSGKVDVQLPQLKKCKECGTLFSMIHTHCPGCQAEWKP